MPTTPTTLWRYRTSLPFEPGEEAAVSLGEGMTPLVQASIGDRRVLVKLEQLSPTWSFKDRGAVMLALRARRLGASTMVADSSGNAGRALAAYAARAQIACRIFVPASTPVAKISAARAFGADVVTVDGTREETAAAAMDAVGGTTMYASHVWDPFFTEGTKTFAFELWEQLAHRAPDRVVLPLGNGTLVLGAWLGFTELSRAGLVTKMPEIVAVQAAACSPIADAFERGDDTVSPVVNKGTSAGGIAIAAPPRGRSVLASIRATGGTVLKVSEDEISAAARLATSWGLTIDPSAAASIAGLTKVQGEGTTVGCITGWGPPDAE
jgi:threonine synthase